MGNDRKEVKRNAEGKVREAKYEEMEKRKRGSNCFMSSVKPFMRVLRKRKKRGKQGRDERETAFSCFYIT